MAAVDNAIFWIGKARESHPFDHDLRKALRELEDAKRQISEASHG